MEKLKCSFPTSCKQSYPQFHKIASYTHSHNADDDGIPLIPYVFLIVNILNMLALLLDYLIKEEARMKYINANLLLPDKLVKELQRYIQGGYIYVPVDEKQRRYWGELSGYKEELRKRNSEIIIEYNNGFSIKLLAEKYNLSVYAIRKIIYQK